MRSIKVFVCENDQVSKEIIDKYFDTGKITYAASFYPHHLEAITQALDDIQQKEI